MYEGRKSAAEAEGETVSIDGIANLEYREKRDRLYTVAQGRIDLCTPSIVDIGKRPGECNL